MIQLVRHQVLECFGFLPCKKTAWWSLRIGNAFRHVVSKKREDIVDVATIGLMHLLDYQTLGLLGSLLSCTRGKKTCIGNQW